MNLGVGFSLAGAWIAEVNDYDGTSGNAMKWTLFGLFGIQWVVFHVLRLMK